jgi:GDP-6-deoxy-D-talose 4-dehydrogenase
MNKVLITGIDGFTGRYLATELKQAGYEVHGLLRFAIAEALIDVDAVHVADLSDLNSLGEVVQRVRPDFVVHLAAISYVAHGNAQDIYQTNVVGTRNLLQALENSLLTFKSVLIASSANIYGNHIAGVLDETPPPNPANDYAVSKLAMEYVARLYAEKLPITITRPFNYTGVGQTANFLIPKIISHVRQRASEIELGNLEVERDFSDVRNVVQHYRCLLESPAAIGQTFNVCSGQAWSLQALLATAQRLAGHSMQVRVNPAFVRANEVRTLVGNPAKLLALTGHRSYIPMEETLRWMLTA